MQSKKKTEEPPQRDTYRHGDLRRALLEAGIALARAAGPDAVVLREATRRAGVVPNAAYRHFASREDLFQAVRAAALSELAIVMEREIARIPACLSLVEAARARLRAVGRGYLKFARSEPGLFHTAFSGPEEVEGDTDTAKAGRSGMNPFQLLGAALDELSNCGALPAERRRGAEYLAWSAVHGLALLVADGPLRNASAAQRNAIAERLLDMVEKGI